MNERMRLAATREISEINMTPYYFRRAGEYGLFFPIAVARDDRQRTRGLAVDLSVETQAPCGFRMFPVQQRLMDYVGLACTGVRCDWPSVCSGRA
jgi:hypothetical protein